MNFLILIFIGVAGIMLGVYFGRKSKKTGGTFAQRKPEEMKEIRAEAREALTERTEGRKEKILYLMNNEAVHQEELKACNVADLKKGITSENVAKFLDVSKKTARKYLNELEDENKIKQIGKTGREVYYVLK